MKQCTNCGTLNDDRSQYCAKCGNSLYSYVPVNNQPNAPCPPQQQGQYGYNPIPPQQNVPYQYQQVPPQQPIIPQKKKGHSVAFIIIITLVIFFIFALVYSALSDGTTASTDSSTSQSEQSETTEAPETTEATTSPEEYKELCKEYSYKDIARNPNDYKGEFAKFKGKVVQVQETTLLGTTTVTIRVNVTAEENEFAEGGYIYNDTVYVTYYPNENESRILEDDIITIYGELTGLETYTSVLGESISIPGMTAKYIEINE